jgi:hypothetical protein
MPSKTLRAALAAAATLTLAPLAAHAQWWHEHPAYLHAMSDLRQAYWLVAHHDSMNPDKQDQERAAAGAIHAAYENLKAASMVDSEDIDAQPPADWDFGDHPGRLHHALELLRTAHDEVNREEDDPAARGFKARALHQIDDAAEATDAAIHAENL